MSTKWAYDFKKKTRKPLAGDKVAAIWEHTKNMGVLYGKGGLSGNVFRIKPPMCIGKEDVDFGVDVLRKSIKAAGFWMQSNIEMKVWKFLFD